MCDGDGNLKFKLKQIFMGETQKTQDKASLQTIADQYSISSDQKPIKTSS